MLVINDLSMWMPRRSMLRSISCIGISMPM
jgi:hypothetical protein